MKFAVIGNPVEHSISPALHSAVYEQLGIDAKYDKIHVPEKELGAFVRSLKSGQVDRGGEILCGLNVTIPHKIAILPLLDEIEGDARLAGAVNTVVIKKGTSAYRLSGYNTDMEGLLRALKGSCSGYKDSVFCIVGAGGAALGAAVKAASEGAKIIRIIARNKKQADSVCSLAAAASGKTTVFESVEFGDSCIPVEAVRDVDIFLNATPLGMQGVKEDFTEFVFLDAMPKTAFIYDCVYIPAETSIVREARLRGLRAENGLSMLVWQGLLSDVYFLGAANDVEIDPAKILTQEMFDTVYEALETALHKDLRKV